jgi:hypothetical protein
VGQGKLFTAEFAKKTRKIAKKGLTSPNINFDLLDELH